jgi:hypothetical protein
MEHSVLEKILLEIISYETNHFTIGVDAPYDDGGSANMFGHTESANPPLAYKIRNGTLTLEEVLDYDIRTKFRRFANPRNKTNERVMLVIVAAYFHGSPFHHVSVLQLVCNLWTNHRLTVDGMYGSKTDLAVAQLSKVGSAMFLTLMKLLGPRIAEIKADKYRRKHNIDVSDGFAERAKHFVHEDVS